MKPKHSLRKADGTLGSKGIRYKRGDVDPRTRFTLPQRRAAIWNVLCALHPKTKYRVAKDLGTTPNLLTYWIKRYEEGHYGPKNLETFTDEADILGTKVESLSLAITKKAKEAPASRPAPLKSALFTPKRDFYDFMVNILGYKLLTERTHKPMCDQIQDMLCRLRYNRERNISEQQTALHLWPRGSFKSTIGAIGTPLYSWAEIDPNLRFLLDSETQDLSRSQQHSIRVHLEDNPEFKTAYGEGWVPENRHTRQRWGNFYMDIGVRTDFHRKEPSLSCAGVDVAKTGSHFDVIVMDDLHSERNTAEQHQIEKVVQHYRLSLSLLEPDGIGLMFGTRWAEDDVYGHIIEKEAKHWHIDVKKAIDDDGNLFFPERLNATFLEVMKQRQGPTLFNAQYLLTPFGHEDSPLDAAWLQYYDEPLTEPFLLSCNLFATLDPACSTKKKSDRSVWEVWAWDATGDIWLLDGIADRIHPHRIIERTHERAVYWNRYGLYDIGVEAVAYQEMLKSEWVRYNDVYNRTHQGNVWLNVIPIQPKKSSKFERIRALQPKAFNKQIHLPRELLFQSESENKMVNFTELFVREWERFPRGKYDDTIDDAAMQLVIGYAPSSGATLVEDRMRKLDPEYAEYLELTRGGNSREGRNWYTT